MNRTLLLAASILTIMTISATSLSGCYSPKGGLMPYSGGAETYFSYEVRPVTIVLKDLRNDQVVFTMDVPGGKQLTLQFFEGKGDDKVYSPDLMKYAVLDIGSSSGSLSSALTVPPAPARRIDVFYRDGTEYTPAAAAAHYRTDQLADRPAWWTPQGGPMPEAGNPAMTMYDN